MQLHNLPAKSMPELPGANVPNPPPLVDPNAPKPALPPSWQDQGRIVALILKVLNEEGPAAAKQVEDFAKFMLGMPRS